MNNRYSRKTTKKTVYKLTPKDAETIIKEEFTTIFGNRMQKRFIFKPHLPSESTIQINLKGDRKEAE